MASSSSSSPSSRSGRSARTAVSSLHPALPGSPQGTATPPPPPIGTLLLRLVVIILLIFLWVGRDPLAAGVIATASHLSSDHPLWPVIQLAAAISFAPGYRILWTAAILSLLLLLIELVWAAWTLVSTIQRLRRESVSFVRIRLAQPQSVVGNRIDVDTSDVWHALHSILPRRWWGIGPRPWITTILHGCPESPALLGALIGGGSATLRDGWVQKLRLVIQGHDPKASVDEIADPLQAALHPGRVAVWRDLGLSSGPAYPIRIPEAVTGDTLGTLAASIRTPRGVDATEIQIITRPIHHDSTSQTGWRAAARRRIYQLRRTSFTPQLVRQDLQTIQDKLEDLAYTVAVRLVAVGSDAAACRVALDQMQDTGFGQFAQRGGISIQRFQRIGGGQITVPDHTPGQSVADADTALVEDSTMPGRVRFRAYLRITIRSFVQITVVLSPLLLAGSASALLWHFTTASLLHSLLISLAILAPGLVIVLRHQWRRGDLARSRIARLINRIPRPDATPRLLLPFPCWWPAAILGTAELGGLWHLPSTDLGMLIRWLSCQYLPAPAHAYIPDDATDRVIIGYAQRSDGSDAPVGPSLTDLRKVTHLTAGMGAGKSRLLANLAQQFIPTGFILLDGKGDDREGCLVATVLQLIPPDQFHRVTLIDMLDAEWPIGINPLAGADVTKPGGATLAVGLVFELFSRLDPDTWARSQGMHQYAHWATLLVLEAQPNPTIADIKQALADASYRNRLLATCTNPPVREFWLERFPQVSDQQKTSMEALLRRFDNLMADETTRYLLTQPIPTVDFLKLMDDEEIVLCPLPHVTLAGLAEFLGMLLFQAVVRAAFRRTGSDQTRSTIPLMIDELQVFIGQTGESTDMQRAITQLRSLGVGGIYAHQSLTQLGELEPEMLINAANRIVLQTSEPDASAYARFFSATDLTPADISGQDPNEHQYVKLLCNGIPAGPFSIRPLMWPKPVEQNLSPSGVAWQRQMPPSPRLLPPPSPPVDDHALPGDISPVDAALIDAPDAYRDLVAAIRTLPRGTLNPQTSLDETICTMVYQPTHVRFLAEQLARMPEGLYQALLARWEVIRAYHRAYILAHPDCIPDGQQRLRWVAGRLKVGTPLVFAAASYLRQTWTVKTIDGNPVSIGSRVEKKKRTGTDDTNTRVVSTAHVGGLGMEGPQAAPRVQPGTTPDDRRAERQDERRWQRAGQIDAASDFDAIFNQEI